MGYGLECHCPCGYSNEFFLDIGFNFIKERQKVMAKIKKGKFGADMKQICMNNNDAVVAIEKALYRCPSCKSLNAETVLDIYGSSESGSSRRKLFIYTHICPECQSELEMISTEDIENTKLECPKCGKIITDVYLFDWD